jgi:hypothetical protein
MEPTERLLLAETVAGAVGAAGSSVDSALTDLDWLEMLRHERDDAIDIVFRTVGGADGSAHVLDDVVASALGTEPRPDLAVLLPPFGSWQPPGSAGPAGVRAAGLATGRVATADEVLVVCGPEPGVVTVPRSAVAATELRGIDPDASYHWVEVDHDVAPAALGADAWGFAVALARRAVAAEMAGACRAMLDLARAHALERVQFDRPVARFQAVRHRLADALVAVEALDAALVAAADEPGPVTAALAKAVAGRTARTVGTHCQQVLAGIGFTTEHPFHRFLKRTMALDGVFGSADALTLDLGRRLLASREVPTLIEL